MVCVTWAARSFFLFPDMRWVRMLYHLLCHRCRGQTMKGVIVGFGKAVLEAPAWDGLSTNVVAALVESDVLTNTVHGTWQWCAIACRRVPLIFRNLLDRLAVRAVKLWLPEGSRGTGTHLGSVLFFGMSSWWGAYHRQYSYLAGCAPIHPMGCLLWRSLIYKSVHWQGDRGQSQFRGINIPAGVDNKRIPSKLQLQR